MSLESWNSSGDEVQALDINEVIIQRSIYLFPNWINQLFSEENKVPVWSKKGGGVRQI